MPTEKPRISFAVPEDLMDKIDSFRFDNRIRNQSQAVIQLMERGLEALNAADGIKKEPAFYDTLEDAERELLGLFRSVNAAGQTAILANARGVAATPEYKKGGVSNEITA